MRDGIEKEGIFQGITQIVNLRIVFKETCYYNTLVCNYIGFQGKTYFQNGLKNILTIVISFSGKFSAVHLKGIYYEHDIES